MSAKQSTTWFWSDWAGDRAVRSLSPSERGLWIDLICLASDGEPQGFVCDRKGEPLPLEQIAHFANCSSTAEASSLIDGILSKGAASRDRSGRLYCRRMVRDAELSVKRRRAGVAGAAATKLKWQNFSVMPGHLPGHLPGANGTRPTKKSKITTTETGTAREDARSHPSGSAPGASGSSSAPIGSETLAAVLQKKGWVP